MARNAMELAARLEQLRREQVALLFELAVAQEVEAQMAALGIQRERIARYSFDYTLLGPTNWERVKGIAWDLVRGLPIAPGRLRPGEEWVGKWVHEVGKPEWYNCVRLKDGSTVPLDPFVQAAHARTLPADPGEGEGEGD